MKQIKVLSILVALCAFGQTVLAFPMPENIKNYCVYAQFDRYVTLKANTQVNLELDQTIDFNAVTPGSTTVRFSVILQVKVDGDVVIERDAYALGRVKALTPASSNDRARMVIELDQVIAVDGEAVPLVSHEEILLGESPYVSGIVNAGTVKLRARVANDVRVKIR